MDYERITIDVERLLRDEQPRIDAYMDKIMKFVPPSGVTREMFRAVARDLSEMMFATGIARVIEAMRQSVPVAEIDASSAEKKAYS